MDLRSFSNEDDAYASHRIKEPQAYDTSSTPKEETKPLDEADVRNAIGHFSKMSNDQLMSELVKHVGMQKAGGKSVHMKDTVEKIKPFLNVEQKKRLEQIVGQLDI